MSWPLVGRSGELRTVEAALASAEMSGVVIYGAAGVGKSRVAREALATAAGHGWITRWAVGTSSARSIPLGAFTTWAPPGVAEPVQLLRGVIDALTAAPAGEPVVIGIDDVHLLDDLSTFVVHQIVSRQAAKLILTVREGDPIPPAMQEVWRAGRLERLHMQPLPLPETTGLLSQVLGGPVEPDAAQRLWNLTLGNTLYLSHIVEQEIADGRITSVDGTWHWVGDPRLPPSLVELIESRTGDLPGPVGDVIDVLAVGEPVELDALRTIVEPDAVEEAETRGLILLAPTATGHHVRLSHPIYGEVRRKHAPATKLRRLRRLVATELAASADRDEIPVLVRRAALSLDSDLAPDADLLTRAAHGAVWLADLVLAERLALAAVRAGAGAEPSLVRAHALSWLGRGQEADEVLAAIDPTALTDRERARLAFLRASNLLWALGDPDGAKALIDEASRSTPAKDRGYIDAFLAVYWFAMDEPAAALAASEDLAPEDMPPVVGAETAWVLSTIHGDAGRTTTAVTRAQSGYVAATRDFDNPQMRFNIADSHVGALLLAGRIDEAREVAAQVHGQAANLPGATQLIGTAVAGRAALGAGDLRQACTLLEHAATGLCANHSLGWGYRYQIPWATALAMRGDTAAAAETLQALTSMPRPFRKLDHEHSVAGAWVAASQGAASEAVNILLPAAERAAAAGQFAAEVICLQTAAQFGERGCGARLSVLAEIVEGPRAALAARFAEALAHGDAPGLAAVAEQFAQIGDHVAAVDASSHAAIEYRRRGLRGSSLGCSAHATGLAEQFGISTPALRQASGRLPLTDREYEIVMLIGEGLSNRAVAERLTLSVRTVESHIYRAMSKTGTSTREELAALLPRRTG